MDGGVRNVSCRVCSGACDGGRACNCAHAVHTVPGCSGGGCSIGKHHFVGMCLYWHHMTIACIGQFAVAACHLLLCVVSGRHCIEIVAWCEQCNRYLAGVASHRHCACHVTLCKLAALMCRVALATCCGAHDADMW